MAVILAGILALIAAAGGAILDAALLAGIFAWALVLVFGFGFALSMRQRH